jgi:propanol-preferring alcohol dehydrogenase
MYAMVLRATGAPLEGLQLADREPGPGEIRVHVTACGVCRTDLHVVDGELPDPVLPIIPGHEIVGRVDRLGPVAWFRRRCGRCARAGAWCAPAST